MSMRFGLKLAEENVPSVLTGLCSALAIRTYKGILFICSSLAVKWCFFQCLVLHIDGMSF